MSQSEIKNFFTNQTIFLTGGTGFLGKILVEKILRVCEIQKLHLLVRPKKGKSVNERFDDFFNYPCFERLKEENPGFKEKIVFVHGDCEKPNLGLDEEVQENLIQNTNISIHAAANVKFDQTLRVATNINVKSTVDMLKMAKKMPQLKSFIYVSTAYSNCPKEIIDEKCYPPPMTPEELFCLVDAIPDDNILDAITPKVLQDWPNCYTFTKSITEYYLENEGKNLPIGICRPTIVTSTYEEPIPGWNDNFYGPSGIATAAALGVLRSYYAKLDGIAHLVPVDFVTNHILAIAWEVATLKSREVTFYNNCATEKNLVTWRRFMELIETYAWDYPSEKVVWYYTFKIRENYIWHKICIFFYHTVFAYMADFALFCIGREPLAVKNYEKMDKMLSLTTYFATRRWFFIKKNTDKLWNRMGLKDRELFQFDIDSADILSYAKNSIIGFRVYMLKDPLETVPKGVRKIRILQVIHYTLLALFYFLLYKLITFMIDAIF